MTYSLRRILDMNEYIAYDTHRITDVKARFL